MLGQLLSTIIRIIFLTFSLMLLGWIVIVFIEVQNQSISKGYNKIRPKVIRDGGEECLYKLSDKGINFT